jgi:hypothetical protein
MGATMKLNDAVRLHTDRLESVRRTLGMNDRHFFDSLLDQNSLANKWLILMQSMVTPLSEDNTGAGPQMFGRTADDIYQIIGMEEDAIRGETVFVSESVMAVVASASRTMEPEPIYATDLLYDHGLLIFQEPIVVSDLHPRTGKLDERLVLPIRAIGWKKSDHVRRKDGTIGEGVLMIPYTDHDGRVVFRESMRRLAMEENDEAFIFAEPPVKRGLMATDFLPWAFGVNWSIGSETEYDFETRTFKGLLSTVGEVRLFFLSLMRFAWQEIVKVQREAVDRPVRREAQRVLKDRDYSDGACVLRLRREVNYQARGDSGTPLRFRVVVRGHWRRQWYRSLGPSTSAEAHRTIWIDPHIRGDEALPIKEKHKVTAITR